MLVPITSFMDARSYGGTILANPEFASGYYAGMYDSSDIPSPQHTDDWETYHQSQWLRYINTLKMGVVDSYRVGYNAAVTNALSWIWINDPTSPHNKSYLNRS